MEILDRILVTISPNLLQFQMTFGHTDRIRAISSQADLFGLIFIPLMQSHVSFNQQNTIGVMVSLTYSFFI